MYTLRNADMELAYLAECWDSGKTPQIEIQNQLKGRPIPTILTSEFRRILPIAVYEEEVLIAYVEQNPIIYDPKLYIRSLVVNPEHRGKGHGKRLVQMLKEACEDNEIFRMELEPTKDSKGFWEKLGFKPAESGKNMYLSF